MDHLIGTPSESWAALDKALDKATAKEVYTAYMLADEWCGTGSDRSWEEVYEEMEFNPLAQKLGYFIGWLGVQQCYELIPPAEWTE